MTVFHNTLTSSKNLDDNWVHLMIAARNIGLSKEEVKRFIILQTKKDKNERSKA